MTKSDYSEFHGTKEGIWLWCLHCERCYKAGEYREIEDLQMCPYPDCSGDTVMDAWTWKSIRAHHRDYPVEPERGKVYPLYSVTQKEEGASERPKQHRK